MTQELTQPIPPRAQRADTNAALPSQPPATRTPSPDAPRPPLGHRLVAAALEILAEEGLPALTLRRVARQAEVSHAAPARHFRSLSDLLAEVAAHGFEILSAAIEAGDAALPEAATASDRLQAGGRAYCRCAVANPALFALMFRDADLDLSNPHFERASKQAFGHLLERVDAAQAEGWQPDRDTRELAGATWSVIHGLATLWADGSIRRSNPGVSLEEQMTTTFEIWMGSRPEGA